MELATCTLRDSVNSGARDDSLALMGVREGFPFSNKEEGAFLNYLSVRK